MSSPSSSIGAPACQQTAPKHFSETAKTPLSTVKAAFRRAYGHILNRLHLLDDDGQAELIQRYFALFSASGRSASLRPPTAAEVEKFWTEGEDAVRSEVFRKAPSHTCCAGVDMPGVGHVHASGCEAMARRASLPEPLRSFVSEPQCEAEPERIGVQVRELIAGIDASISRRDRREGLIAELIFASRDLAEHGVRGVARGDGAGGHVIEAFCVECFMSEHLGVLAHGASCRTGRVLRVLAELLEDSRPKDTEAAHGLKERVCLKCGERGGQWDVEKIHGKPLSEMLGLNQLVGMCGETYSLHTHRCLSEGGAR